MTPGESKRLVEELQLSDAKYKKWAGKRYLVLISVFQVEELEPFMIDRSNYGKMDDWHPVQDIESVKQ